MSSPESTLRLLSYAEAVREAQAHCLATDSRVCLMGLGVPDPKAIFGTCKGLQEQFGPQRVFDIPLAENAVTGAAIGLCLRGMRPILTHQRVDFALVAMEQMLNQAAKWHYMFGGRASLPLVIRMVIGRGWGQGPQHSQSLQSLFAHVPGLKVVMPTTAHDAKGMLIAAVEDPNPVIVLEHRWLHGIRDAVPAGAYRVPLDQARVIRAGADVTIAAVSYMALEALRAADLLAARGISAEVVDLRSIAPLDEKTLLASVRKTGRLVVADTSWTAFGTAAEVAALVAERAFDHLTAAPRRLGLPPAPVPTSPALADGFYPRAPHVAAEALALFGQSLDPEAFAVPEGRRLDQPDPGFTGPF